MDAYPKIASIYERDRQGNLLFGHFAKPEFEYLQNNAWVFQEKVDGTNTRVLWDGKTVSFKGREETSQLPATLTKRLEEIFTAHTFRTFFPIGSLFEGVCLYGEGYGAGIQKGGRKYLPDTVDFVLFDVWLDGWWLQRHTIERIATAFSIRAVPIIGQGTLADAVRITKDGFNSKWGPFLAEGMVIRTPVDLRDRHNRRIITKIKHRDFAKLNGKQCCERKEKQE